MTSTPETGTSEPRAEAGRPATVPAVAIVLGLVGLAVAWLGADEPALGVALLGIMTAYAALLRYGHRAEAVAILAEHRMDERRRTIDDEAIRWAYGAVIVVALGGFGWEIAQGAPGAFTIVAATGGATHILATFVLRRRR